MKSFRPGSKPGASREPKREFGRGSGGSSRSPMFPAVCATCGQSCEVPFQPSGHRPVLCNNCFTRGGDDSPRYSAERKPYKSRSEFQPSSEGPDFEAMARKINNIEAKLDRILDLMTDD